MSDTIVSWRAITPGSPITTSDNVTIGKVTDVAASEKEDIFHGVVFKHHMLDKHFLVPAGDIGPITDEAVSLTVDAKATEAYEVYEP